MKKGFTLIELLIVMVLVGVLVTIALPKYRLSLERGRAQEGFTFLRQVAENLNAYYIIHGKYPSAASSNWNKYLSGENASDYVRRKFFNVPSQRAIEGSSIENKVAIDIIRPGFYTLSVLLDRGETHAFKCGPISSTDTEYVEYCGTLGFTPVSASSGTKYYSVTGGKGVSQVDPNF